MLTLYRPYKKALRLIENILKLFTKTAGEENWTSCVRHAFGYGINELEAIRVNFISRSFFGSQEHFSVLRFSAPGILYSIFTTVQCTASTSTGVSNLV